MAKTMPEAMAELRRDVTRWKIELAQLKTIGDRELIGRIHSWIEEADSILERWDR